MTGLRVAIGWNRIEGVHVGRIPGILLIATIIVSVVSFLLLIQTSGVAWVGYDIQRLEESRDQWRAQNYQLEAEIARLSSLDRIDREARAKLKMVPAGSPMFVTVNVAPTSTSLGPAFVSSTPADRAAVRVQDSSGLQTFLGWLARLGDPGTKP